MSKAEESVLMFNRGLNCSQVVLSAFCEEVGLDEELAFKISCGFGGGMRQGEVCGAVTGALMVLGLKYGQSTIDDKDSKERTYVIVKEFCKRFKSINSSIICKELLGCDLSFDEARKYASENGLFDKVCPKLIKDSIEILEGILEQQG